MEAPNTNTRKINRRTTRTKTQVINVTMEEIRAYKMSIDNEKKECTSNENKEGISSGFDYFYNVNKGEESSNLLNDKTFGIRGIYKEYDSIYNSSVSDEASCSSVSIENKFNDIVKPIDTENRKKEEPVLEEAKRTFCFRELLNWVQEREKRNLFPSTEKGYDSKEKYPKTPVIKEEAKGSCLLFETELAIIPPIKDNPFIVADRQRRAK